MAPILPMSQPTYLEGGLYIHLDYGSRPACGQHQWALYLHINDSLGGSLYRVEATECGLVAKHRCISDITTCHSISKQIALVPVGKLQKVDNVVRLLDNGLQYLKECTSMKWVLMSVTLLMRDNVVETRHLRLMKQDMIEWANMVHNPEYLNGSLSLMTLNTNQPQCLLPEGQDASEDFENS